MIPRLLRDQLDEVQVSKLAEYLAERLDVDVGETLLQFYFADGRYDRMSRFKRFSLGDVLPQEDRPIGL